MKKIPLLHPGRLLLDEFIKPNAVSVYRVAKDSGIPQSSLQLLVSGKRDFSAEAALRLGLYFGIDPQFWLNLQGEYDLRLAQEKLEGVEGQVHPLKKAA